MYYLLLAILYPISLLPLRGLYLLSDMAYVIMYYLLKYRRAVVADNLLHAFPEKSAAERKHIEKKFYRAFCDQWIETLKSLSISPRELNKRMQGDWSVGATLHRTGKHSYLFMGHFFNWEWLWAASNYNLPQTAAGFYKPLHNHAFDRLIRRLRGRHGGRLLSTKNVREDLLALRQENFMLGLIADQNPSNLSKAVWFPLLHREVPFFRGSATMAMQDCGALLFLSLHKVKRGYYRFEIQLRYANACDAADEETIMQEYALFIEEELRRQPENWLWSHKRWKHAK